MPPREGWSVLVCVPERPAQRHLKRSGREARKNGERGREEGERREVCLFRLSGH